MSAAYLLVLAAGLAGIRLGIFARGETPYLTGLLLAPQLPLEEAFFLTFLCYLTMLLATGSARMLAARRLPRPGRERRR